MDLGSDLEAIIMQQFYVLLTPSALLLEWIRYLTCWSSCIIRSCSESTRSRLCASLYIHFIKIFAMSSWMQASPATHVRTTLQPVKCYSGGREIHLIPSISKILSQKRYHCVQYTRRHLISLLSHCIVLYWNFIYYLDIANTFFRTTREVQSILKECRVLE